jgi:hypothetical protein
VLSGRALHDQTAHRQQVHQSLNITKVTDTLCEDCVQFCVNFSYVTLFQRNSRFSALEFVILILEVLVLDLNPPES